LGINKKKTTTVKSTFFLIFDQFFIPQKNFFLGIKACPPSSAGAEGKEIEVQIQNLIFKLAFKVQVQICKLITPSS